MRVVEVNSIDRLPGLRLAWRSLLSETPGANFHQSCEWLEAAYRHQPPGSRLRVLLVTGGGETVGILPLVQTERPTRFGTLRVLGYPRDRWSPFNGPIGPHPTATLMAGLRYLSSSEQDWDDLEFRDVNRAAADYQRTRTALQVAGMSFQESDELPCPVVDLSKLSNDFVASLPVGRRQFVGSAQPVPTSIGRLTLDRHRPRGAMYDDANPVWDLFDRCLELPCGERTDATKEYLRAIHVAACRSGAADLNVLRRGNEIVACCYNVQMGGTLLTVFAGDSLAGHTLAPTCADGAAMQSLVSKMLHDSVTRQDVRWFPGRELACPQWLSAPLRRARLVCHRRHSARRVIGRLAQWLPRKPSLATLPERSCSLKIVGMK